MDRVCSGGPIADHHVQAGNAISALAAPTLAAAPAPAPAANPPSPLIRTKLHPPGTRAGRVSRPRLQERIAQGLRGPLAVVTAPAGFGKTTLVVSAVAACGMRVAWLSLDKSDHQPGCFLTYLVAALQETHETNHMVGSEAALLPAAQAPPEAILPALINDVDMAGAAPGREIALVLDDFQFISSHAMHEQLAFLVEHCPPTLHIVIATRSDPPPLARLRARGQAIELRGAGTFRMTWGARSEICGPGLTRLPWSSGCCSCPACQSSTTSLACPRASLVASGYERVEEDVHYE